MINDKWDFLFTLEYVKKLLLDLDEEKSCEPDSFPPKILKLLAPAIAYSLIKLFNHWQL